MARLVSVLAVGLALTACAGGDDSYREELPPIDRRLVALGQDVGSALREAGGSDERALAHRFAGFARRLGGLRAELEALEPPGSAAAEHERLLRSMARERAALATVAQAVRAGDANAARAAATEVVRAGAALDEARRRLAAP